MGPLPPCLVLFFVEPEVGGPPICLITPLFLYIFSFDFTLSFLSLSPSIKMDNNWRFSSQAPAAPRSYYYYYFQAQG